MVGVAKRRILSTHILLLNHRFYSTNVIALMKLSPRLLVIEKAPKNGTQKPHYWYFKILFFFY